MLNTILNISIYGKIYIFLVSIASIPLLIFASQASLFSDIPEIFFWLALSIFLELGPIYLYSRDNEESIIVLNSTVSFATVMVVGLHGAIIVSIFSSFFSDLLWKKPFQKAFFNAGQYGVTTLLSGTLFYLLKQSPDGTYLNLVYDWIATLVLVLSHYLINVTLVSIVISFVAKVSFFSIFFSDLKILILHHLTSSTMGLAMVSIYSSRFPFVVLPFVLPLFLIDQGFRWYYSLHDAAIKTIKALATIVDKRDKYTAEHSSRVAEYSRKICTQMNLPDKEAKNIEIAASIHDLGKIGIEDSIITKNGSLTKYEYEIVKKHPEIAYELIKNLRPYEATAAFVLHHHEWTNGNGYPNGLKSAEIPFGAKIISVADAYDAMTTIRPYRDAYSNEKAIGELKKYSGIQFEPAVVDALIKVLENEDATGKI